MLGSKYYFFKLVLPDILFTILFLLLFSIFKFNVEIYLSIGIIYFALLFAFCDYLLKMIFNGVEVLTFKTYVMKKIDRQEKSSVLIFLALKAVYFISSIMSFVLLLGIFKNYFYIDRIYISILMAGLILIIRSLVFKNNDLYKKRPSLRQLKKIKIRNEAEFRTKLNDLIEKAPKDLDKASDEEKQKVLGQMEDLLRQYMEPSDEEKNDEE